MSEDSADLQPVCTGRRRTCALLNSPSPCVNSAIYHIQEMKMTVENWCQQSGKHQPHFYQDKHQYSKGLRVQSRDSDGDSVMSAELYVEGIAISARESCLFSPLMRKINEVLSEVMCLIERLEADRQYAEEALHKEKIRKIFLESKVDNIILWKQKEHSFAVQKEHEACIRDITELKGQLKLEREKLDQVQEKLSHTEVLSQRLHEDINFATKQLPIVKEKIELQESIINQINSSKAESEEVCLKTQNELTLAQEELKKMELDAKTEKTSMEHALTAMKSHLAERLEDLNQLRMFRDTLCAEIKDDEKTIALTEKKCTLINQSIPEMMELEKTEKDRISLLYSQIEDETQKNRKLKDKVIILQEDIEKTKLNGEAEVSCTEEQLELKRKTFAALRKEINEYQQNVEDYRREISKSEKAVKQMREERKQMLREITDNDEQWEKAEEEVTQVVAQHSVTQTKLEEQEQLTFMEEQQARKDIENLKKTLIGQTTAQELLRTQCANLKEELKQQQRRSELTNQQLKKEFDELSAATKALETRYEKVKKVIENLETIQREHKKTLADLEEVKKLKSDQLKAAQDLHHATVKHYDNTLQRISDFKHQSTEYQDASEKMEQMVESMSEDIAELQSVFDVLAFKNKSAALIMSTLQSDINNCQQRTQRSMQTHAAHVTGRKKQMEDTKAALETALKENKQLATTYKDLQKILLKAKQESVWALSEKNRVHASLSYYTELSLLQKRMHKALEKYFKQRSLYSQAELDRCQALSQETDQKIKTAQAELSEEIQLISAFLHSLTDDSTTNDDAGVNKQASPDAAGSNE
ncbi:coiled-coil domain-containing protein 178 [Parambassis ranga]|uniref:Coiled-coil domain-containing protein 178 n=1 Tax=Parambassis ranga TaxID=210632 RepID=A0A6P7K1W2_9TELE|nr:coiled-coil domain-containing protein 178 [Parambassis ranga]